MNEEGWRGWHGRLMQAIEKLESDLGMKKNGMTQKEFARMTKVGSGVAGNWMRGAYMPDMEQFERIADITKQPLLWLVFGHKCGKPEAPAPRPKGHLDNNVVYSSVFHMMRLYRDILSDISPDGAAERVVNAAGVAQLVSPEMVDQVIVDNLRKMKD